MTFATRAISLALLALTFSACNSPEDATKSALDKKGKGTGGTGQTLGPSDLSCVPAKGLAELAGIESDTLAFGLINGVLTTNFPAVVRITNSTNNSCTATAVSSSTLITAKHCLNKSESNGGIRYNYYTQATAVLSSDSLDLSVVVFPEGTFKTFTKISDREPRIGDALMIVGFGMTDPENPDSGDLQKRVGCNSLLGFAGFNEAARIATHQDGAGDYIHYRAPIEAGKIAGKNSMTAKGDSGGPIFINGKLSAIVSFGDTRAKLAKKGYTIIADPQISNTEHYGYDVNLSSPSARALLNRAKTEIKAQINGL